MNPPPEDIAGKSPPADELKPRQCGACAGQFVVPDDFDAPLPEEELRLWYDGPVFPDSTADE